MTERSVVRARIGEHGKDEASSVLKAMGLSDTPLAHKLRDHPLSGEIGPAFATTT